MEKWVGLWRWPSHIPTIQELTVMASELHSNFSPFCLVPGSPLLYSMWKNDQKNCNINKMSPFLIFVVWLHYRKPNIVEKIWSSKRGDSIWRWLYCLVITSPKETFPSYNMCYMDRIWLHKEMFAKERQKIQSVVLQSDIMSCGYDVVIWTPESSSLKS